VLQSRIKLSKTRERSRRNARRNRQTPVTGNSFLGKQRSSARKLKHPQLFWKSPVSKKGITGEKNLLAYA